MSGQGFADVGWKYSKLTSRIGLIPPLFARTLLLEVGFQQGQGGSWGEEKKKSPENAAQAEKCEFNPLKSPVQKENLVCSLHLFSQLHYSNASLFHLLGKVVHTRLFHLYFPRLLAYFFPRRELLGITNLCRGCFFSSFLPVLLRLWKRTFQLELHGYLQV